MGRFTARVEVYKLAHKKKKVKEESSLFSTLTLKLRPYGIVKYINNFQFSTKLVWIIPDFRINIFIGCACAEQLEGGCLRRDYQRAESGTSEICQNLKDIWTGQGAASHLQSAPYRSTMAGCGGLMQRGRYGIPIFLRYICMWSDLYAAKHRREDLWLCGHLTETYCSQLSTHTLVVHS